jgi:predicted negative regulator of RcsB-dependent stress response
MKKNLIVACLFVALAVSLSFNYYQSKQTEKLEYLATQLKTWVDRLELEKGEMAAKAQLAQDEAEHQRMLAEQQLQMALAAAQRASR